MAEFLIKAIDATHTDPVKDAMCYKRGDIVMVKPDGHAWGRLEGLPAFVRVKVPGLHIALVRKYITSEMDETDPFQLVAKRRRAYRVLVDNIPNSIKAQLRDTGEVTVTWDQVKNFVQNKKTGFLG